MNTFYVARTDGLDTFVGAYDDRRRTRDAAAAHERYTAASAARRRRRNPVRAALGGLPRWPGYRGRRWAPETAQPGC
jgi:hypothetical protein